MFRRTRSGARRARRARTGCAPLLRYRKPLFELLEDRRLLAGVTVSNNNDVVNGTVTSIAALIANPGADGISLREAIQAANTDTTADDITFALGLSGMTINLSNLGELPITQPLTINASALAAGITIKAFDASAANGDGTRIFNVDDGAAGLIVVSMQNLTLTGGDVPVASEVGGAIRSTENLSITKCTITGNRAAISGGGLYLSGGQTVISLSTISGNTAASGGGVSIHGGTATIVDTTVSGNTATLFGAGVFADGGGTLFFNRSTASGNTTPGAGAGISVSNVTTTVTNSTISGNSAAVKGGGIYANVPATGPLAILYSTITRNTADSDVNGAGSGGGLYLGDGTGNVTIKNTIIAGNTDFSNRAPDIDNTTAPTHPTITQTYTIVGNNKGSGLLAGGLIGTQAAPINPLLALLANNGGPTKTHAFTASSPAFNAGDPAAIAGAGAVPTNDQRGFVRVSGGRIDIGAFELVAPSVVPTMNLLASSDTGMFNNDRVTNKMQPAFGGVGPANTPVYVYAQLSDAQGNPTGDPFIVGTGRVGSDLSDGLVDGLGVWEVTVEPLADGKYFFFSRFDEPVNGAGGLTEAVGDAARSFTFTGPRIIPDNGAAVAPIVVNEPMPQLVADVNVTVNITHPNTGDLILTLVSPSGTSVLLSNRNGAAGDNYTNTIFDDFSHTPITSGAAPFTGRWRPEEPLKTLFGEPVNGTWRLLVTDNAGNDVGQIDNWTLTVSSPIMVVIDTVEPNTPFLDLLDDTGRHNADNITKNNKPNVNMTTTDPNVAFSLLMFTDNFKFRIYDRYQSSAQEVLIYDSAQDAAADASLTAGDMFTALTQLTRQLPQLTPANPAIVNGALADGVHNLKLEVEDRAGNISHDFFLQITVDTTVPPASFGLPDAASEIDGLAGGSDSGVTTTPTTFGDRVTNDATPKLWGRAEANSIVGVYLDINANGVIDLATDPFLGQATAIPLDGNDAYPNGYWEITSALDLNFINGVPKDGLRRLLVTAEDVAGNPMTMPPGATVPPPTISPPSDELHIFIDTQGPQITNVLVNQLTAAQFNLFNPKPTQTGFTPLVNSLFIGVRDLPSRVDQNGTINDFLYAALQSEQANAPGNYLLVGDHVGTVAIKSIQVTTPAPDQSMLNLTAVTSTTVITAAGFINAATRPEVGDYILVNNGAAAGQVRRVTNFDNTTGAITLDVPLLNLPAVGNSITLTKLATAGIRLNFFEPLPDDRYTLTVRDGLVDPAGNKLDGESHASEPQEIPTFPSGDGVPGGNFVARFTIDSRPEIGNYVSAHINIDANGNFIWDQPAVPVGGDETNVDLSFTLPVQNSDGTNGPGGFGVHDLLFAGKFFQLNGVSGRHFDQLAAYGYSNDLGVRRWIIDTTSDGVVKALTDIITIQPNLANFDVAAAIPVAGNFDNIAANGDEIGLYNAGKWYLDTNRNFVIGAGDLLVSTNLLGHPIVGDFDGDGKDDLAVFNNNIFSFNLANDGFGDANDATITWGFPGVLDRPVAADMDQDGIDDIGLWVPRSDASLPQGVAQWYFLISNDFDPAAPGVPFPHTPGSIAKLNHAFTPKPFGKDIFTEFGDQLSLPIVGNFDPPVSSSVGSAALAGDYDGNGRVEMADKDVWKANFGTTSNMAADGNHDGKIDMSDYVVWRSNLGAVSGASVGSAEVAAPSGPVVTVSDLIASQSVAASSTVAESQAAAEAPASGASIGAIAVDDFFARLDNGGTEKETSATLSAAVSVWQNDDLLLTTLATPAGKGAEDSAVGLSSDGDADEAIVDELLAEFAGVCDSLE